MVRDGHTRLSQAIAEGDGISLLVEVDDGAGASDAQEQGAEGLVVRRRRRRARQHRPAAARVRATRTRSATSTRSSSTSPSTATRLGEFVEAAHARGPRVRRSASGDEDELEEVLELVDPGDPPALGRGGGRRPGPSRAAARAAARRPRRQARDRRARGCEPRRRRSSSSAPVSTPSSSPAATSGRSSVTRFRTVVSAVDRPRGDSAARRGAPARRRPLRAAVSAPQPGRGEHRPARVATSATAASRSRVVRLPVAADGRPRAGAGVLRRAVARSGARRRGRIGLGGVAATWWLGRRAYGTGAALVGAAAVAVATTHVAYSRMAVTDVLADARRHVRARARGRAAASSGRASRSGSRRRPSTRARSLPFRSSSPGGGSGGRSARAAALAVVGVRPDEPVRAHPRGAAWDDISRVQRLARPAGSGSRTTRSTPLAYLDRLWDALGPLLVVAVVGLVVAAPAPQPGRPRPALLRRGLLADADARSTRTSTATSSRSSRCSACSPGSVRRARPARARRPRRPARLVDRRRARADPAPTRGLRAAAWVAAHVPRGDRIAADPSTLPLAGRDVRPARAARARDGRSTPTATSTRLRRRGRPLGARLAAPSPTASLAARGRYPREAASTTRSPRADSRSSVPSRRLGSRARGCGSTGCR